MRKYTKYIVATAVVGAVGVGASFYLIPEEKTLQQMQVRDEAIRAGSFIDFGARYLAGERTTDIVVGYADQLIAQEKPQEALDIVTDYVNLAPEDAVARRKQAEIYQYMGRTEGYIATLNWLAENANDEESLRLLSGYYNGTGDLASQEAVLKRLLAVTEGNDPKVFVDLATIQSSLGDRAGVSETLGQLAQRHPDYMDFAALRLYVLALLDKGDISRAEQHAQRWLAQNFTPDEAADLANILHYNASARSALALLEPYQNVITSDATLLLSYVNALRAVGEGDQAYALLRQQANIGPLSSELMPAYIPLAIEFGTEEEVLAAIEAINPEAFDEAGAVEMIRLAKAQDNASVTNGIITKFSPPTYTENKPVLTAIIALYNKDTEAADAAIAQAVTSPIRSELRIALANECAAVKKTQCVEDILASLPPVENMTPGMVANTADLYMSLNRPEEIYADVTAYRTQNPSALMDQTWLRLVAATGDKPTMEAWLSANAESATQSTLRNFYYTASNNGHHQTATLIAESMYERAQTEENRDILVNAYLRSYNYGKALPYLREAKNTSSRAEGDYVTALERLARNNSSARKELMEYSKDKLNRGGLSQSEQQRYVYLLLNNGEKQYARNVIETNASRYGGNWSKMLSQLDGESGGAGDTIRNLPPEERVQYALQEGVERERQREIAFGLIEDGHEPHAIQIFNQLASRQMPGTEDVNDLLFLLEKHNPQDAVTWMDARRRNAPTQEERMEWTNLLAEKSDPYAFMALVSSDPSLLGYTHLRKRYFYSLARHGSREEYSNAMRPWVDATNDPEALVEYAEIGEGQGYTNAALYAYKRAYALDSSNLQVLRRLGTNAFMQADYSNAEKYLDQYFRTLSQSPSATDNPYLAAYYKAQLLRRDRENEAAKQFFQQTIDSGRQLSNPSASDMALMYSSMFHLGRVEEAVQGYRNLLERNPRDRSLLAEYMTVLIEYKYYEEAQRVANKYDYQPTIQRSGVPLSSNQAYEHNGSFYRFVKVAATNTDLAPAVVDETLRLQMLYARIELENGDRTAALNRLRIVEKYYPNNPTLLGYIASIESAGGNYNKALQMVEQASALSPMNEDLRALEHSIRKVHGDFLKADYDWRRTGNSDEYISTLSGRATVMPNNEIGFVVQNDDINTSDVRRSYNGTVGDDDYQKNRGQIYFNHYDDEGSRYQASVFGNNYTAGAGFAFAFNNSLGRTDLILDYNRPYWDFVEAAAEDATRDRVGFTHSAQLTDTLSFFGETSLNRYNIQDENDVASSYLLRAGFVQRLRPAQPYIGIGYGFDGEYMIDKDYSRDPSNRIYPTFPLTAREIHFLSAIFQYEFTRSTVGDLITGYAVDRLGQHGPAVEARLTQQITDSLEAQARYRFGIESNNSDNNASTVGGHLMWRY